MLVASNLPYIGPTVNPLSEILHLPYMFVVFLFFLSENVSGVYSHQEVGSTIHLGTAKREMCMKSNFLHSEMILKILFQLKFSAKVL